MLRAMMVAVFVFAAAAAAAAASASRAELPPPPAPLEESAPAEPAAKPSPDEAPPVLQPIKPVTPSPSPVPIASEPAGLDGFLVGAMQWGIPCATFIVALPCALLAAYGCPAVICVPCVLPAANGYLAAYVGDRFGKNRAPAIWPVLAAYASALVTTVAGITVFVLLSPALTGGITDPVVVGAGGIALLAAAMASLAVPVSYALSAEPKRPGDDGTEIPGWFAPHHPRDKKPKATREPPDAPPRLTTMRF